MIALTPRQWGYAGAALAIAATLLWSHRKAYENGRIAEAKRTAELVESANEAIRKADAKYANSRSESLRLQARVTDLLNRPLPDPKVLVREVKTNAPVSTCPDLSPEFRVQYNAIAAAGH